MPPPEDSQRVIAHEEKDEENQSFVGSSTVAFIAAIELTPSEEEEGNVHCRRGDVEECIENEPPAAAGQAEAEIQSSVIVSIAIVSGTAVCIFGGNVLGLTCASSSPALAKFVAKYVGVLFSHVVGKIVQFGGPSFVVFLQDELLNRCRGAIWKMAPKCVKEPMKEAFEKWPIVVAVVAFVLEVALVLIACKVTEDLELLWNASAWTPVLIVLDALTESVRHGFNCCQKQDGLCISAVVGLGSAVGILGITVVIEMYVKELSLGPKVAVLGVLFNLLDQFLQNAWVALGFRRETET